MTMTSYIRYNNYKSLLPIPICFPQPLHQILYGISNLKDEQDMSSKYFSRSVTSNIETRKVLVISFSLSSTFTAYSKKIVKHQAMCKITSTEDLVLLHYKHTL